MIIKRALRKLDHRARMMWAAAGADSFLASYPKSGRTRFRFILSQYFVGLAGGREAVDLHRMFAVVPNFDLDPARGIPTFRYKAQRPNVPLILVTHHQYRRSLFLRRPVIFMVRDPRDVIVSAYFHATRHKRRFQGGLDAFMIDEKQGLPSLAVYLNGWANGLSRHRAAVLSYEELAADTLGVSAEVLRFLGHTPSQPMLEQAVAASRFDTMRERELQTGLPAHEYDRNDSESLRMRRGKAGGFADYLSERQAEQVVTFCDKHLIPAAKGLVRRTGMTLSVDPAGETPVEGRTAAQRQEGSGGSTSAKPFLRHAG